MKSASTLVLALVVSGCPSPDDREMGAFGGRGGGEPEPPGATGTGGDGQAGGVGDVTEASATGLGGTSGNGDCAPSDPVDVPVSWSQDRRLAVGQFLSATLPAGRVRQPALLEPSLVGPYLEDLGRDLALDAHVVSNGDTHHLRVAAGAEEAATDSKVHLVVLVDVSPSNGRTVPIRNGVLNALAQGVDATQGTPAAGAFSVVSFAAASSVLVATAPAGSARSDLDAARASLASAEGHALPEALKIAKGLPSAEGESFRHYLLLTDAGFVADPATLTQIQEMAVPSLAALSVAQLATVESGEPAPELRREFLDALVAEGRGATFFFSDPGQEVAGALCETCMNAEVLASFSRWFAPHGAVEPVTLNLPAGVLPATDGDSSGGGGKVSLSRGFSLQLDLELSVGCFQPGSSLGIGWPLSAPTTLPLEYVEGANLAIAGSEPRLAANDRLVRLFTELRSSEPDCTKLLELETEAQASACAEGEDTRSCRFSTAVLHWIEGALTSYCP
jgi:hypothetical protein